MAEPSGQRRTQVDKDRSKQMSRTVTGAQSGRPQPRNGSGRPTPKGGPAAGGPRRSDSRGGGGRSGGAPPPRGRAPRPSQPRRPRRSPTALLTWGTAALVLVIVVVLVVVKVTGSSSPSTAEPWTPVSSTVASELADIPASVFNTVGVSSTFPLYKPITTTGQPALTYAGPSGKQLPGVFFYGAEYCPHCAAERWALAVALDRFGTIKNLGNMVSSAEDSPPSIPTFTFSKASYSSPYIALRSDEAFTNQVNAADTGYKTLQIPTAAEAKLVSTYDSTKYFSDIPAGEQAFPLVDFGNKVLSEENYAPNYLQGFTRDQIAAGLNNAKNPITQAIVASANMLSAAICSIDGGQPSKVCASKGVQAAAKYIGVNA